VIGRDDEVKELNLKALRIAKEVAIKTGTLMAGNICNTTVYERGNEEAIKTAREMFKVFN
jgi:methionine synthase I (cobalamin-dependent)